MGTPAQAKLHSPIHAVNLEKNQNICKETQELFLRKHVLVVPGHAMWSGAQTAAQITAYSCVLPTREAPTLIETDTA
jgi:hypothetical protein